jgi:hypothetical protein
MSATDASFDNINKFQYQPVKAYKSGKGKFVPIVGADHRYQQIQLPPMTCWGVSVMVNKDTKKVECYSVSFQFNPESERSAAEQQLFLMLKERDDRHIATGVANSQKWFGTRMSEEVIRINYTPILKYPKCKKVGEEEPPLDYTRPPSIRAKVACYNNKFELHVFNTDEEVIFKPNGEDTPVEVAYESLKNLFTPAPCVAIALVQSKGLWFVNKNFGESFQLVQTMVETRPVIPPSKCQIRMKRDVVADMSAKNKVLEESTRKDEVDVQVEDSDEEDEHDDEAARESKPEKATDDEADADDDDADDDVVEPPRPPTPKPAARRRVVKK